MSHDHGSTRSRIGASGSVYTNSPYSSRSASPASSIASSQGGSLSQLPFSPDSKATRSHRQLPPSRKPTRNLPPETNLPPDQLKQKGSRRPKINRGCNTDVGGDYMSLQQQAQVLGQNCQELRQENERLQQQIAEGQEVINQLESQCDVTEENQKVHLQTVTQLMMKNVDHNLQFSRAQQEAQAYKQQVTELKNQMRILQEENYSLATKVEDLKQHLDKKRQQIKQKKQDDEEQRQIISSLKNSLKNTSKKMQNMQTQNETIVADSEQQNSQLKLLQDKLIQIQQQQQVKKEQQKKNLQELQIFSNSMYACVQEVKQQLQQIRGQVKYNNEIVQQKILQAKNEAKNLAKLHEESTVSEIGKCFQLLEDAILQTQNLDENNENINNINKNIVTTTNNNNNSNITLRELSLNNLPTDLQKKFNPLSLQFSIKLNKFISQHQNLNTQNEKLLFQIDDINQKLQGLKNSDDETEIFGVQIKLAGDKNLSKQQQQQQQKLGKHWLSQGARFLPYFTLCCLTLASGVALLSRNSWSGGSSRRDQRISGVGLEMYRSR